MSTNALPTPDSSTDDNVGNSPATATTIVSEISGEKYELTPESSATVVTTTRTRSLSPAPPPFSKDSALLADIILRSSDGVRYYVAKTVLAIASPIFNDMLTIAWESGVDQEAQVVDVSEGSRILDTLLRFCYPMEKPILRDVKHTLLILEASRKYEITAAHGACKDVLLQYASKAPIAAYIIACKFELEDIAAHAARETMRLSLEEILDCGIPETEEVCIAYVRRLSAFRKQCQQRLSDYMKPTNMLLQAGKASQLFPWLAWNPPKKKGSAKPTICCSEVAFDAKLGRKSTVPGATVPVLCKAWWYKYQSSMETRLSRVHVTGRSAKAEANLLDNAVAEAMQCRTCRYYVPEVVKATAEGITAAMNRITAQVASEHTFTA